MCLDDIIDFIEDTWIFILPVVLIAGGAFAVIHYDLVDVDDIKGALDDITHIFDGDQPEPKIEIVAIEDNGVYSVDGTGTYKNGSEVELSVMLYLGWFFEGWYSETGELLSEDYDYTFKATESKKIHVRTSRGYGVNLYKTEGIQSVDGRYTYHFDETADISVKVRPGYRFDGWYDIDGNLVSSKAKLTLPEKRDYVLVAKAAGSSKYSGDNVLNFYSRTGFNSDSTYMALFNQTTGDYVDSVSGISEWSTSLTPGLYELVVRGTTVEGKYKSEEKTILVEGQSSNTYYWTFKGKEYTLTWTLDSDDYEYYKNITKHRRPADDSERLSYFTYNSRNIQQVASKLTDLSRGMTNLDRANLVLKFVQLCTDYQYDSEYIGKSEYWKYPLETLFEARGDCEDTSILYCTLMKAMGYDSAILLYTGVEYIGKGHAAASVALDNVPGGTYYNHGGKKYYYCESTSDEDNVGVIWDQYDRAKVLVIP